MSNLRVEGTRIGGVYDLELCRGGTPSMQLGVALNLCREGGLDWGRLVEGFQESTAVCLTNADYRSILAMNHLSRWIRVCEPCRRNGEGVTEAVAEAESYVDEMVAAERTIVARP